MNYISKVSLSALSLVMAGSMLAQSNSPYHISKTYSLGGDGGWDYVIPDPPNHRLFIARESRIMVVDEDNGKVIGEVTNLQGAHGVAIATSSGRAFATAGEEKAVVMFDPKTFKAIKRIPAADDADAIIYDASSDRVFSFNGDAHSSTVISAKGDLVTNIPLGGKPEYGASAENGRVYVNLVDTSEIVEIDSKAAKVLRRWSTDTCKQPVSMAIDEKHNRLFSGCRSGVMAVSDYRAGRVVTTVPIGKGVDGTAFDLASGNVFASNGDGSLNVIHQDSADKYQVLQTLQTPAGSRNLGLDSTNHRIYVPSAKFGPPTAEKKRGAMVPNSFSLMVVDK